MTEEGLSRTKICSIRPQYTRWVAPNLTHVDSGADEHRAMRAHEYITERPDWSSHLLTSFREHAQNMVLSAVNAYVSNVAGGFSLNLFAVDNSGKRYETAYKHSFSADHMDPSI